MNTVRHLNQNTTEYWAEVRLNAKMRKAAQLIADRAVGIRSTMIYEQYVLDHLQVVKDAAREVGLLTDPNYYTALLKTWATTWGMPEIIENDEATYAAAEALYG